MLRRSRAALWSKRAWRPRLVFWFGALTVGLTSVLFAKLADGAQHLFASLTTAPGFGTVAMLLVPPSALRCRAGWRSHTFRIRRAAGSRRPSPRDIWRQTPSAGGFCRCESVRQDRPHPPRSLLRRLDRARGADRAGARAIMMAVGRAGGAMHARGLILAVPPPASRRRFNTPLAGIVFAIEEMGRAYEARTNGLVISAVVVAASPSLRADRQLHVFRRERSRRRVRRRLGARGRLRRPRGALGALFSAGACGCCDVSAAGRMGAPRRVSEPRPCAGLSSP